MPRMLLLQKHLLGPVPREKSAPFPLKRMGDVRLIIMERLPRPTIPKREAPPPTLTSIPFAATIIVLFRRLILSWEIGSWGSLVRTWVLGLVPGLWTTLFSLLWKTWKIPLLQKLSATWWPPLSNILMVVGPTPSVFLMVRVRRLGIGLLDVVSVKFEKETDNLKVSRMDPWNTLRLTEPFTTAAPHTT